MMKWIISLLLVLLIGTNTFWIFRLIDAGVSLTYRDQRNYELEETRKQLMLLLPTVAKSMKKMEIISAASQFTDSEVHDKDGCTWVGWLGFQFNDNDQLISVSPSWVYTEPDPCYPVSYKSN